jgi:hypothetical protein
MNRISRPEVKGKKKEEVDKSYNLHFPSLLKTKDLINLGYNRWLWRKTSIAIRDIRVVWLCRSQS